MRRLLFGATLGGVLCLSCATLKSDAKAVADVCRPELIPDVENAAPYVAVYVSCEIAHGDCAGALASLQAQVKADVIACAVAEAHAATVKLAGQ